MFVSRPSHVHILKYFGFAPGKVTTMREKIRLAR